MARIFITGSADGLGRAAARHLLDQGHKVVLHARSPERAVDLSDLAGRARVVTGDLSSAVETRALADQVMPSDRSMPSFTTPVSISYGTAATPPKATP